MHLRDLQDRAADSVAELLLLSGANPLILGRQTVLMRLLSSQALWLVLIIMQSSHRIERQMVLLDPNTTHPVPVKHPREHTKQRSYKHYVEDWLGTSTGHCPSVRGSATDQARYLVRVAHPMSSTTKAVSWLNGIQQDDLAQLFDHLAGSIPTVGISSEGLMRKMFTLAVTQ